MKNSIVYLGIVLVSFTNVSHASKVFKNHRVPLTSVAFVLMEKKEVSLTQKVFFGQKNFGPDTDSSVMNPETVIKGNFERPIEEIIAENNKIIESNISNEEVFLYIEKPIEEVIADDNQIIESTITTQIPFVYLEETIENIISEDNKIIESIVPNEIQPLNIDK